MISVRICSPDPSIRGPWDDLARRASSNVFLHPAALLAAEQTNFAKLHVLQAWDQGVAPPRLVGFWALQSRKIGPFWPTQLKALPYNYAFLSSPMVDPACVDEVMPAFVAAIAKDPALPNVISLHSLDAEAPSFSALLAALSARGGTRLTLSRQARPFVTPAFGVKRSGSTRKKLRQDWNRLSALGTVDILNDRTSEGVEAAFECFLTLEAESWKGAGGTALLCDPRDARFSRRLLQDLAATGHASVALLRIDGRAIAAQVLMIAGATAYTWKTAFDADFAKYSPGALLVDKVTEQLFSDPGVEAIDSCSSETGFMGQLWSGRRSMVDLLIDVGPRRSLGFRLEAARELGIERLRNLRNRLRGWDWPASPKKAAAPQPRRAKIISG
jgi:CelD/BcsL family acetyltransferase involved in cellulose biosynthesis